MNKSLVLIDTKVPHYQTLLAGVNSNIAVEIIPPDVDGIEYLTQQKVSTIHLVSHGSPGCLYLGNHVLNLENLSTYASQLSNWGVKELFIYGCRVASGDAGEEFIHKLHQLTGANIAASSTLTGNVVKGGNWELEVTRGEINSETAFSESVKETYTGVLEEIVVNTLEDEDDGVSTENVSLRDAINRANALPGEDSIIFDPSLNGGTITLTVGEPLDISGDLTIEGLGADQITVDGDGVNVFEIDDGFEDQIISVTIEEISIVNGNNAINNLEELTVQDSTISDNRYNGIAGGTINVTNSTISDNRDHGIFGSTINVTDSTISGNLDRGILGGTINVTNTTIFNNTNSGIQGSGRINVTNSIIYDNRDNGIFSGNRTVNVRNSIISGNLDSGIYSRGSGTVNVTDSTIFNNTNDGIESEDENIINVTDSTISDNTNDGINGYAINVTDSTISNNANGGVIGATINVTDSSISGNLDRGINGDKTIVTDSSIFDNGGGIDSQRLNITNSTIHGNSAATGAGILIERSGGAIANIVKNTTITNNEAPEGQGSGIAADDVAIIEIANSIIAGNVGTDIDVVNGENTFTSLGGNVIGLGNAASVFTANRDIVAVEDPLLGELADNGGDTQTHLPLEESPAIDLGINSEVPEDLDTDQRGAPRITGERVEAGAVELLGVIQGTNEGEFLLGTDLDDTIEGLGGDDLIKGADGNDDLDGGADDDSLQGAPGEDTIRGGTGNDTIDAGRDPDVLLGGPGNDVLIGGRSNDTLIGGDGRDEFQFLQVKDRRDVITDFKPEADFITVANNGFGGNLSEGTLDDDLFVSLPRFTDLDDNFTLGFVHATEVERLAFIDTDSDIPLTQLAILEGNPELEAGNFRVF